MVPEEADDLWIAYNLIAEGDTVLAVTVRYCSSSTFLMFISVGVSSSSSSSGFFFVVCLVSSKL